MRLIASAWRADRDDLANPGVKPPGDLARIDPPQAPTDEAQNRHPGLRPKLRRARRVRPPGIRLGPRAGVEAASAVVGFVARFSQKDVSGGVACLSEARPGNTMTVWPSPREQRRRPSTACGRIPRPPRSGSKPIRVKGGEDVRGRVRGWQSSRSPCCAAANVQRQPVPRVASLQAPPSGGRK